jgi:hypothetical protein
MELGNVPQFEQGTGSPDYKHNTTVDFNGVLVKYVRITGVSNWSIIPGVTQYGLSEVRFLYLHNQARYPNPQDEAIDAGPDMVLGWRAGREAATHEVYFDTDRQAVMSGTEPTATLSEASYDVGTLELGQSYYWRVDEVNNSEIPPMWQGDVWSFNTPDFLVVDNFEGYDDTTEGAVWATWTGWEQADNGVYVGHENAPYCEQTIVHGGGMQSMPFYFDNTGGVLYSEAKANISDLGIDPDWTKAGIKALTLYFYGDPGNTAGAAEELYVKLNGVKVAYDDDADDIQEESWHEWNIKLTSLSGDGVDLQNVTEIIIGIDQVGASGIIYFDNIRLYPARCIPGILKPAADLNDDCVVDYADIEILASNWLMSAYQVIPVDPGTTDLAGHWTFDNAANIGTDATGNNDGEINGNAGQSANAKVGAGSLALDGDGDFLNVRGGDFFSALDDDGDGFTAAAWVQFAYREEYSLMRVFATNMSAGGTGGWGFGIIQSPARLRFTTLGIQDYDTGDLSSYLPYSQWTHVAFVYKSDGDADFYIDGAWAETIAGNFSMNNTDGFLIGGLASPTATEWFEGLIDDLRIYDNELSQGEIGWLAGKTVPYAQELSLLLTPKNPAINAYDDGTIDLKDYALLADQWLDEQLWPEP